MRRVHWMATALCASLATGCSGAPTAPVDVTATSATLTAQARCDGTVAANPCVGYWQIWREGQSSTTAVPDPPFRFPGPTNGTVRLSHTVTGLQPGALYHFRFCGHGDGSGTADVCVPPPGGHGVTGPGTPATDLDATVNFRTANPSASPATVATVDAGRVRSSGEAAFGVDYYRDGGQSVRFSSNPPRSLWLFGDSPVSTGEFIAGNTAAIGTFVPGQPATSLTEVPTGNRTVKGSSQFLPTPTDLPCPGGVNASYPGGAAARPGSTTLVVSYVDLCLGAAGSVIYQRSGLVEYDPASNRFSANRGRPFTSSPLTSTLPIQQHLSSPVLSDGFLYFFPFACVRTVFLGCAEGRVYVSRVSSLPASWASSASFRWWAAGSWSSDATRATSILPAGEPVGPFGANVGDFSIVPGAPARFALIEMTDIVGGFKVLRSPSPTGPWTTVAVSRAPDGCGRPPGQLFFCRTFEVHPELSSSSRLVYSWFSVDDYDHANPKGSAGGHVRLASIPW
jgi:hypothetical protein